MHLVYYAFLSVDGLDRDGLVNMLHSATPLSNELDTFTPGEALFACEDLRAARLGEVREREP